MGGVPMREDCRHFQSRTYTTGEVARFCTLDLAPEAPWRCPQDCARYERDIIDGSFVVGSLVRPPVEEEPEEPGEDIGALLDQAEDVVNHAGPAIVREVEAQRVARRWWQFWRRGDDGGDFRLSNR